MNAARLGSIALSGLLALPAAPAPAPDAGFGRYPALRVADGVEHPVSVGFGPAVTALPAPGGGPPDLLVGGVNGRGFGVRLARFRPAGGVDAAGLPVYDAGETAPLAGAVFERIDRPGGGSDLLSNGKHTRHGHPRLALHRAKGAAGDLSFHPPEPVPVGGAAFAAAAGDRAVRWSTGDLDGDGVVDLLVAAAEGRKSDYWPNGESLFAGVERADAGMGRGYDVGGNWLGSRRNVRLSWARGGYDAGGGLAFGPLRPVHAGRVGFQVQWKTFAGAVSPGLARIGGEPAVLLFGDLDRLLALRFGLEGGELVCGPARPLLGGDGRLVRVSHTANLAAADLDGDGVDEVLVAGNPGRVVVLRGAAVGAFEEAGSLHQRGGPLAADSLASPALQDRDGDGFPDLVAGDADGRLTRWPGTADPTAFGAPRPLTAGGVPVVLQAGPTGSLQGPAEARWGYTQVGAGRWGGEPALFVGDATGRVTLCRPTADPDAVEPEPLTLGGEPLGVAWRVKPAVVPAPGGRPGEALLLLDADGDLALAVPAAPGSAEIAEVRKLPGPGGGPLRTDGPAGDRGRTKLAAGDWDGDGVWDVLAGIVPRNQARLLGRNGVPAALNGSQVFWFRNVGSAAAPRFAAARLIRSAEGEPFGFGYHCAAPCLADLSGRGRALDLLIGTEDGKVHFFRREELAW